MSRQASPPTLDVSVLGALVLLLMVMVVFGCTDAGAK